MGVALTQFAGLWILGALWLVGLAVTAAAWILVFLPILEGSVAFLVPILGNANVVGTEALIPVLYTVIGISILLAQTCFQAAAVAVSSDKRRQSLAEAGEGFLLTVFLFGSMLMATYSRAHAFVIVPRKGFEALLYAARVVAVEHGPPILFFFGSISLFTAIVKATRSDRKPARWGARGQTDGVNARTE